MACETCGAVKDATARIQAEKRKNEMRKIMLICGTILLVVAMVCGTVAICYTVKKQQETILEQQYALNMQYDTIADLLSGAEITTETIDGSEGGVAAKIEGDGNSISAGEGD